MEKGKGGRVCRSRNMAADRLSSISFLFSRSFNRQLRGEEGNSEDNEREMERRKWKQDIKMGEGWGEIKLKEEQGREVMKKEGKMEERWCKEEKLGWKWKWMIKLMKRREEKEVKDEEDEKERRREI